MSGWRPLLRQFAYRSGALSLARVRMRRALTVIMLHRVVDPADLDFVHADPTYTLSAPMFDQLLAFFQNHYSIVSLGDVMAARDGTRNLPDHALLITFDDGWADNLRYAAPLLKSRELPAVIFVVPQAILSGSDAWWQEQVFAAGRSGMLDAWLDQGQIRARIMPGRDVGGLPHNLEVVTRLALMDEQERTEILATLPSMSCHSRMMLKPEDLPNLAAFGIDIGLHGYAHAPLTAVADVTTELCHAREAIAELSKGTAMTTALGCPHGRYDDRVIAGTDAAGVTLVFTSDPYLNLTKRGMLSARRPLGRINVEARHIAAAGPHRLDPAAAARWLWARDCR